MYYNDNKADDLFQYGLQLYYIAGDEKGINRITEGINTTSNPKTKAYGYLHLGEYYLGKNEKDKAEANFEKAVKLSDEIAKEVAFVYSTFDLEKSFMYYQKAQKSEPKDLVVLLNLSIIGTILKKDTTSYEKELLNEGVNPIALALHFKNKNLDEKAKKYALIALEKDAKTPLAYVILINEAISRADFKEVNKYLDLAKKNKIEGVENLEKQINEIKAKAGIK